jgi:catechol 2,3-dioxygenase-like lactoylglutathione lyase family enzyme
MITGLNHVTFGVRDLDRSFEFYTKVLGLQPVLRWAGGAYLQAGESWIALIEDSAPGSRASEDYSHVAFSVPTADFAKLSETIRSSGARIWQENSSEGESLYFLEPDGHKLEIHSSDLAARLRHKRANPSPDMRFFGALQEGAVRV